MGPRLSCPSFVGRVEELAQLKTALSSTAAGGMTAALIGGEAGIGKTRLVDEFCDHAREQGCLVASGFCSPVDGRDRPYGPLVGVLRNLDAQIGEAASASILGPVRRALGLAPDGVAEGDVGAVTTPLAGELARTRLADVILTAVAGLADQKPAVLVFEDLQWADSASLELIDCLVRNLGSAAVMLVGTFRSDELNGLDQLRVWLSEVGRHRRVVQTHLEAFDRSDVAAILAGILGHEPDAALAEAVYARSEGNPFFAEELAATGGASTMPPRLQDVIRLRLAQLSPGARHVLAAAATVGGSVDHQLLAAVAEQDDAALDDAVAEVVDRTLLVVDAAQSVFQFRHGLVRDAVYESLLPGSRTVFHRRVATYLAEHPELLPTGPGHAQVVLASHWWGAGAWAEALVATLQAADAAESVFAFAEAHAQLERALSCWERARDPEALAGISLAALLGRAADDAYLGANPQRAVELARSAADQVDPNFDRHGAALNLARLGRNLVGVDLQSSFQAFEQAGALLADEPPSTEQARVLAEQSRMLMIMSRYIEAETVAEQAIAAARAVAARSEEGHATNTLGCCWVGRGQMSEGIALIRSALEIAEELENPDDLNRAYINLSDALFTAGRLNEAAAIVLDALAIGEQLGGIRLEGATSNSVEALINLGRWDQADALLSERGRLPSVGRNFELLTALLALRRGRFEEADRALAAADAVIAGQANVWLRGSYHMIQAELALEQDRPRDASEHIDHALSVAATSDDEFFRPQMCALGVRALADAQDGAGRRPGRRNDIEKARLVASALAQEAGELVAAPAVRGGVSAPQPSAFALQCRAEESRLQQSDPALWENAAAAWVDLCMPYDAAYCRWRQAEALLAARGDREVAAAAIGFAWRESHRVGAVPLQAKVERLAARARIPILADLEPVTARPSVASDLGITAREVEVLGQLAAGRTDAEIAEDLFISKKTASVHVSNLLRKLGVGSRFEAGEIGRQAGLGLRRGPPG